MPSFNNDPLMHAFTQSLNSFTPHNSGRQAPSAVGTAVFLIIALLMWNLLTDSQKKDTLAAISPKTVVMPPPTKWIARNGMAYRVDNYAPINNPARGYPGQYYYPAQPYAAGPRGGY